MSPRNPAVDAYIAKAQPFAQPILNLLREAVHRAVPEVEEQIKWSRPFFVCKDVILGNMAAFKEHCSFGLWGGEMAERLRAGGVESKEGMGSFGKIASVADLPPVSELEEHIRHAAESISSGRRTRSIQRVAKPSRAEAIPPETLVAALRENKLAQTQFAAMSPSCRREYIEWIEGAKREETRARRVETAVAWIAEGKERNWQYERAAADRTADSLRE